MKYLIDSGLTWFRGVLGFPVPVYAHIGVTHRCNLRCRMCVVWKRGNKASEMTPFKARRLAAALRDVGVRFVSLGGGEPFVRDDIAEIVNAFAMEGLSVRLLTNGVGIDPETARRVIEAGMTEVSVSLDSLDPGIMAEIHGKKGVGESAVETMRMFRSLLPRGSIPVVNTCVSSFNIEELTKLTDFAGKEGFFISFIPVTIRNPGDEPDGFASDDSEFLLRRGKHGDVIAIFETLVKLKKKGAPILNSTRFLRDSARYLTGEEPGWQCDAGRLYFSVSPEGGVSICHRFTPFADAGDPDLALKLTGAVSSKVNDGLRRGCPGCMRPCWAEVTHAMRSFAGGYEMLKNALLARKLHGREFGNEPADSFRREE